MDRVTQLIKTEIKKQYKSVRQFSEKSGIPYSTISNALSKGIGGTSYDTVIKMCNILNLKQVYDTDLTVFNEHCYEICTMLTALDERAILALKDVLKGEHERCTANGTSLRAHNDSSTDGKSLDYKGANA